MTTTQLPTARYRNVIYDSTRWSSIDLRAGDIVISTPPKAGTTWTQMLCALLVFDGAELPSPLEQLSPWVDMLNRPIDEVRSTLEAQPHRRIIKTHTPLDGLPWRDDVDYVVVGRDPRDIAISFDHHMANFDIGRFLELRATVADPAEVPPPPPHEPDPAERLRHFVDGDLGTGLLTLADVVDHLSTAWARRHQLNVHLLHYRDLKQDAAAELLRLGRRLRFALTPERAAALAGEASLERMRDKADEVVPSASQGLWRDPQRFIRTGGTGEWEPLMTAADRQRYEARLTALAADDELVRWLHHGSR